MLEYEQAVKAAARDYDESLGKAISEIEEKVKYMREGLFALIFREDLTVDAANEIHKHLKVSDYYWCAAWAALVEDDRERALTAKFYAQRALDDAIALLEKSMTESKNVL